VLWCSFYQAMFFSVPGMDRFQCKFHKISTFDLFFIDQTSGLTSF
jgi:hypothetical protein